MTRTRPIHCNDNEALPAADPWLIQVHQQLDASLEQLDPATQQALTRARRRALLTAGQRRSSPKTPWFLAASVGASAALAALLTLWVVAFPPSPPSHLIDDLELLGSVEELEFYQTLEFYHWLEQQEPQRGLDHAG